MKNKILLALYSLILLTSLYNLVSSRFIWGRFINIFFPCTGRADILNSLPCYGGYDLLASIALAVASGLALLVFSVTYVLKNRR
ncbi:MAG: hypothetical protein OXT65_06190 [Alphaproteobacteria bacterium]|nr:hypothetical protein [Alphaproteobacteria bacterium]